MSDEPLIPPSPSEDDYVRQVTAAEPPALLAGEDPFALFADWLRDADAAEPNDPNAMALATVDASGLPDVRMVLLKDAGPDGFVFYTNLESAKGRQLAAQPKAALLFHWKSLRRQVRVRGTVERVSDAEADAYWATRARPSQIGGWASEQSRPLPDRMAFERRIAEFGLKFGLGKVPAIFATVIYAAPPLIRLTDLGIRQVDREVMEAVTAFGANRRQQLFGVQLPLALPSIMAGINQTTMMALSMVVIASMIGARGLGEDVLVGIQTLNVGKGLEAGLAIVILAVVIDRITQAYGRSRHHEASK